MEVTAAVAKKPRVFYGWWVLGVSATLAFLAASTSQLFTGAMLPVIQAETGWSRSSITLSVTLGSFAAGFASPFFGRLADRHGPRLLSACGLACVAAALFAMGLSGGVGIVLFGAAYVVARGLSTNTLGGVVARTTVVNWFRRMRGRALGLLSMAIPLGGAALVPVARLISSEYGWEAVYYVFGVLLLLFIPVALAVLRRRPEDLGLLPDGDLEALAARETGKRQPAFGGETEWTLKQAMGTRSFWLLIGAMTAATCATGGIGFHQAAYFEDQGVAAAAAALAVSAYAISGAAANALWGFLIEHVSERLLGSLTVFVAALSCLYLLTVETASGAFVFAIAFGLMARGEASIIVIIQAQYFGRGSFGAISGFSTPFTQIALGSGPSIAALSYDLGGGSYTIAFLLFGAMYLAAATCIWSARKPPPTAEVLAGQHEA